MDTVGLRLQRAGGTGAPPEPQRVGAARWRGTGVRRDPANALHLTPRPAVPWIAPPSLGLYSPSLLHATVLTPRYCMNQLGKK